MILPFFLCRKFIKSVIQGFLPGIVLKLFLIFLPTILMIMSKFEGFTSLSSLERRSATRYYLFNLVNVFLGSIIAGSALEQLNSFIKQSANEYVFFPFSSLYICFKWCNCCLCMGVCMGVLACLVLDMCAFGIDS